MQSTDNKHSISQLEKRTCTSLFCSKRKSKERTLVASQNRGQNTRAAQVFNISPASDCTSRSQLSLAVTTILPTSHFCLPNMVHIFHYSEPKQAFLLISCKLTWPRDMPKQNCPYSFGIFHCWFKNTRRTYGGVKKL